MGRMDEGLAFLLRYENVAWYQDGCVRILDRRVYPGKVEYALCRNHREVAAALRDMVTQSLGPYLAAGMGMALAAHEARHMGREQALGHLRGAAHTLANARPTTARRMAEVTEGCLCVAVRALEAGASAEEAVFSHTLAQSDRRYLQAQCIARFCADLIPKGSGLLTQCFAETNVGFLFRELQERGMDVKIFCAETRPYLQGARLTASVARDQGMDVTVVTDNMPAYLMQRGMVGAFTAAADAICMDGYVVNKVGTLQYAICANRFGLPVLITGNPDPVHPTHGDISIEERQGEEVLYTQGVRSAMEGVKGYYPAFDITPPSLISAIVTDRGPLPPLDLARYARLGER